MMRLIEGLAWSFAGFMGGFCLCWILLRSANQNAREGTVVSRREFKVEFVRSVVGVLLLLMVALSGVSYYRTTSCQAAYNEAVGEALSQRSAAQGAQTRSQIELLEASLSGDTAAAARESREYIAASKELERVRALSPLPSNPKCGGF